MIYEKISTLRFGDLIIVIFFHFELKQVISIGNTKHDEIKKFFKLQIPPIMKGGKIHKFMCFFKL